MYKHFSLFVFAIDRVDDWTSATNLPIILLTNYQKFPSDSPKAKDIHFEMTLIGEKECILKD